MADKELWRCEQCQFVSTQEFPDIHKREGQDEVCYGMTRKYCDSNELAALEAENAELKRRLFDAEADAIYTDRDGHLSEKVSRLMLLVREALPQVETHGPGWRDWIYRAKAELEGK